MKIELREDGLSIRREKGEPRIQYESTFYYRLAKEAAKKFGWDTIRKEMCKDGHMVDNGRFYLVDRKRRFAFFQEDWETYDICKDYFNQGLEIVLAPLDMRYRELPLYKWLKKKYPTLSPK